MSKLEDLDAGANDASYCLAQADRAVAQLRRVLGELGGSGEFYFQLNEVASSLRELGQQVIQHIEHERRKIFEEIDIEAGREAGKDRQGVTGRLRANQDSTGLHSSDQPISASRN